MYSFSSKRKKYSYSITAQQGHSQAIGSHLKMKGLMIRDGIWISNSQRVEHNCGTWNIGQGQDEAKKNHFVICK